VFLLRNRKHFSDRQKMKTNRVYLPLLVLAVFPSLFMADFYSHLGGFLGGVLLALLLSPVKERLPWAAASGSPAAVAPGAGIHSGSGNRFGPGHDPPRHES
jgi:membrane associated rhomboid family serine protease